MPIIVSTTTAIVLLLRGGDEDLPFFDPEVLRSLLDDALEGDDELILKEALTIADDLETLLNQYTTSVESSIDAYIEASSNRYIGASEVIERLEPLDRERALTLQKVISQRQSLFNLLSDEQWEEVFD